MKQDLFNTEPAPPSKLSQVVAWVLIACLIALAIWPFVNFFFMLKI